MDILRYVGIGLIVWAGARFVQGGFGPDSYSLLAVGAGVVALVAGYGSELRSVIPSLSRNKSDVPTAIETSLRDYEQIDVESIRHLSARFTKSGDKEAVELLRKLNDHLFSLHHPEGADEKSV